MKQLLLLLALISPSFAQTPRLDYVRDMTARVSLADEYLPGVDYAGMFFSTVRVSPGQAIRKVPTLPATCTAVGAASSSNAVLYQGRVYQCASTNTWTFAVGQTAALTSGRVPFVTTNGVLTDSANWTFTTGASPNFFLQSANAAHVAAVFRGASSQSANIAEFQSNAGTVLASVNAAGRGTFERALINNASDSTQGILLAGSAKGIRFGTSPTAAGIEGVDNTGAGSYQPLYLGGSQLQFSISGTVKFTLDSSSFTFSDAINLAFGTTTGTKFGTATTQKLGFFNATPIVQPSSTGQTAGFTAGSGTAAKDDSTYTGGVGSTAYTTGDIVRHLKNLGLIAQ